MKRILLLLNIFLLIQIGMDAQNKPVYNNYATEWKQVEQFEKEDLPKSALGVVDAVLKKAIAEKNTQQIVKSLLVRSRFNVKIDTGLKENVLYDISDLISKVDDLSEKALLHSMLAELYEQYFNENRWELSNTTNLVGVIPQDIKEWTVSVFESEIKKHLTLSVTDKDVLLKSKTNDYKVLIEAGKDSPEYYPTLYDFLMKRAIRLSENLPKDWNRRTLFAQKSGLTVNQLTVPAKEFISLKIAEDDIVLYYYQQYLKNLLNRNMTETIILTELDKIKFLESNSGSFTGEKVVAFVETLIERYNPNPMCGALAEFVINKYIQDFDYQNKNVNDLAKVYKWCERTIADWLFYPHIDNIKKTKLLLETPQLTLTSKGSFYADESVKIKLAHKNLQSLSKTPQLKLFKYNGQQEQLIKAYPVKEVSKTIYLTEDSNLDLGFLPVGDYVLKGDEIGETYVGANFVVTRLGVFSRNSAKNAYDVYVVDRMTGKPIEGASVSIIKYTGNKEQTVATTATNALGLAGFSNIEEINTKYGSLSYKVSYGDDFLKNRMSINYSYGYEDQEGNKSKDNQYLSVLVDRQIYRPGQTVYYKGVVVSADKRPVEKSKVTVLLMDASSNKVTKKELVTNEFGSVAGEFILPKNGLLGSYHIRMMSEKGDNSTWFQVEEYKRPTFDVTFDKIDKTYSFGEEVVVKGYARNYSGVNLQDTKVRYTIKGNRFSFWRYMGDETFSIQGEAVTKDDGSFEIRFVPEAGDLPANWFSRNNIQQFTITADVTDSNNETQSGIFSFNVGDVSMLINMNLPAKIEKTDKEIKLKIEAVNLNGVDVEISGAYNIYALDRNDSISARVGEGRFATGDQPELLTALQSLKSGKYKVKLSAKDSNGKDVEDEKDVVIYSYNDKRPPIETNEWLVVKNKNFSESQSAEIILGVSDKDVNVLYELQSKDKAFERKRLVLSGENKLFTIPNKVEYGESVRLVLSYMKDQKFYSHETELFKTKEEISSTLKVKLDVFRDKLRPGQEETWTLSVKSEDEKPSYAEVLVSMYDLSLDKLSGRNSWGLNLPNLIGYNHYYWQEYSLAGNYNYHTANDRYYWWYQSRMQDYKNFVFDKLNLFGVYFGYAPYLMENSVVLRKSEAGSVDVVGVDAAFGVTVDELSENIVVLADSISADRLQASLAGGGVETEPQIRRNFNETAFFYPQLRTNEKGETQIRFTVPESNTQWRFRALAYDKEMRVGDTEQIIVTRKELMITPNMPRFVRQGDKTSISTKISNLSDNALSGNVKIEFFDLLTDELLNIVIADQEQTFSLNKDASSSVSWMFDVPQNIEMIGCRIVATSDLFSDGEQHVLAVLPNRMLVTESMPFDVTESEEFVFEKMKDNQSKTLENYKLTLEYTSNPAWYAVQALPVLSNPTNENAVNWIGAYFVNRLGMSIMKQYPQVAKMIEAWKQQGGSKETLISKLLKNEELKTVLLSETPWVLDAKTESEQMERLSLLFDLNNANQQADQATRKLSELQHESGGWEWYKGMSANRSVTQFILHCYAKLQEVGSVEYSSQIKEMQMRALKYLDEAITEDFKNLKKYNKDWEKIKSISTNQLEYLFVRTYYRDIPITQEAREAERFYTTVVKNNWIALDLYERSLLVHILMQNGEKATASKIVMSLRERATVDKKQGMYWANNNSRAFGFGIPVIVHVFLMDALEEAGSTEEEMNQLTQWMVKQKQAQAWQSTPGTILAISRMLSAGKDVFSIPTGNPQIKVGNKNISTEKADLGTGYIKEVWSGSDITKDMNSVNVVKMDKKLSYGALYWQYYEDLDKITANKTGLNVDKQLYKNVKTESGHARLEPITETSPLKVNDKVTIRLVVRVDRDMDFVHLKDMRASCFEPTSTASSMKWDNGVIYYMETRDASTNIYFDHIAKGTYVFEYEVYASRQGVYSNGITTIQALYAPEFVSHTAGISVNVK